MQAAEATIAVNFYRPSGRQAHCCTGVRRERWTIAAFCDVVYVCLRPFGAGNKECDAHTDQALDGLSDITGRRPSVGVYTEYTRCGATRA
ncbi:hypothetical protein BSIN_2396 [Burkholderia singularis]|uniref:Uncharacterized protein n=1 Tax=Burkholderia singularis TaxID=1503053 RepID=A0A238H1T2_9BURK|nr:hypothetical protein BSIN_2396 [Burkholderia singularis]